MIGSQVAVNQTTEVTKMKLYALYVRTMDCSKVYVGLFTKLTAAHAAAKTFIGVVDHEVTTFRFGGY